MGRTTCYELRREGGPRADQYRGYGKRIRAPTQFLALLSIQKRWRHIGPHIAVIIMRTSSIAMNVDLPRRPVGPLVAVCREISFPLSSANWYSLFASTRNCLYAQRHPSPDCMLVSLLFGAMQNSPLTCSRLRPAHKRPNSLSIDSLRQACVLGLSQVSQDLPPLVCRHAHRSMEPESCP